MKFAHDFKMAARVALTGRWKMAVVVGLVASILGAAEDSGSMFRINIDLSNPNVDLNFAGQSILSTEELFNSPAVPFIAGGFGLIFVAALVMGAVYFVLSSFVSVGYAKFNLNLADGQNAVFENLFEYFSCWKTTAVSSLLRFVYVFLWSLLFVIPGIVASLSYSMTNYILAESPDLTASEAIERSKAIMQGNRWRFFCLQLSFIGWDILALFTFGIGFLFLAPYKQAAYAAFYRDVSRVQYEMFDDEYNL